MHVMEWEHGQGVKRLKDRPSRDRRDSGQKHKEQGMEQEQDMEQKGNLEMEEWDAGPEQDPAKPWVMVAIVTGMLVLAAIICAILWHFTHLDGKDRPGQESIAQGATEDNQEDPAGSGILESDVQAPGSQDGSDQVADGQGAGNQGMEDQDSSSQENDSQGNGNQGASNQGPGGSGQTDGTETDSPGGEGTGGNGSGDGGAGSPSQPPQTDPGTQDPVSGDKTMTFRDVQESVTPKDVINLRSVPSTADAGTVVTQVANGVTLSRTGINDDTGWSRIEYDGQILYGVSQYLTTDLSYKPPVQAPNPNRVSTKDGRVIIFTDCDDNITPKEYVNLRTEPSTTEGEATVSCQLNGGEVAHRTGYSADSGWSRVEYNGQVLYVVTSMVVVAE